MLIVRPDFDRRIDLPGAGPCPRPVEVERSGTGFSSLVSLRIYTFPHGVTIDGEAEGDEVFIVVMRGEARLAITPANGPTEEFSLSRAGGLRAVYMPPRASYRLSAESDCDIAYARAGPAETPFPQVRGFAADGPRLDVSGHALGMDLAMFAIRAPDHIDLSVNGQWPERFIHVRADPSIGTAIAGADLGDWSTAALAVGEKPGLTVAAGSGELLIIAAATRSSPTQRGAIETE